MFRFYAELNDFLRPKYRQKAFPYLFNGNPSVKDAIQAIGVPHTEVDLILVNGNSVSFGHHLQPGDQISVYPVFETLDISDVTHLRPRPLRKPKFVLDVHLGRLARYLRLAGFDTVYENSLGDREIIDIARSQKRIILTRDLGILKNDRVTHGYFIRSDNPRTQIQEVVNYFSLHKLAQPFSRCTRCNGKVKRISRKEAEPRVSKRTFRFYRRFYCCTSCGKIYWEGSHVGRMQKFLSELLTPAGLLHQDGIEK